MPPTSKPKRLKLSRRRGWRLPAGAVSVARSSRYGNPFTREQHGQDAELVLYRLHLALNPELQAAARVELRGRDLACWCPIGEPCHADVLLDLANGSDDAAFAATGQSISTLVQRVLATVSERAAAT